MLSPFRSLFSSSFGNRFASTAAAAAGQSSGAVAGGRSAAPPLSGGDGSAKEGGGEGRTRMIRKRREVVPNVMVQFGTRAYQLTFVSHPGVMAVSKLLEMRSLVKPQAEFTQENIEAIREFDEELARKCQIARDNSLRINMMDLEHIDQPGYLSALVEHKGVLRAAQSEVMSYPAGGPYPMPKALENYQAPEVKPRWNPQYEVGPEVFEVQPGYRQEVELRGIVKSFLNREEGKAVGGKSAEGAARIEKS